MEIDDSILQRDTNGAMSIGYQSFYDLSGDTRQNSATSIGDKIIKQNKEDIMNNTEYENELAYFKHKTEEMYKIFEGKRKDYGPTTTKTFEEYGIVAMLVRMEDKFGRLKSLTMQGAAPHYESIEDTLMDLANYCIITLLEMAKQNAKEIGDNR